MAEAKNQRRDVVFRRIHGRVVPIKVKERKTKARTEIAGISAVAAGATISAVAGRLEVRLRAAEGKLKSKSFKTRVRADQIFRRAAHTYRRGEQLDFFSNRRVSIRRARAARFFVDAQRMEKTGNFIRKFRGRIKPAALGVGGSLIAGGFTAMLPRRKNESQSEEVVRGVAASAAGAAFVAGTGSKNIRGRAKSLFRSAKAIFKVIK